MPNTQTPSVGETVSAIVQQANQDNWDALCKECSQDRRAAERWLMLADGLAYMLIIVLAVAVAGYTAVRL